jgi:hypothetical protein
MSWDAIDLTAVLTKQNKKKNIVAAKPTTVVKVRPSEAIVKKDIRLKLTATTDFSITQLTKLNKGFTNI